MLSGVFTIMNNIRMHLHIIFQDNIRMEYKMKSLKGIILAGGYGTRLRPITLTTPKPLCKICGESVIERLLRLMPEWDINEVAISTMYLSDIIRQQIGESKNGLKISYVTEETPLGSAGGAKLASEAFENDFCDNFIILSGDGIFDFDIRKAVVFHEANDADVTIVTYPTKEPLEYGVVLSDKTGKIKSFCEKPSWSEVRSNTVNTGIYIIKSAIFKDIPNGRQFDFSKDLFPFLLGTKRKLYSYEAEGYWCDIGDLSAYYKCNVDAMCGKIKNVDFSEAISEKEAAELGIKVSFPVYISKKAKLSPDTNIGKYSVILDNSDIGAKSEIIGSIIMENVKIGSNTNINGSIICENTVVENNTKIYSGTTIGAGCTIAAGATITEGVSIWAGKSVGKGFCVTQDVLFENNCKSLYSENGLYAGNKAEGINSDYISRIGYAVAITAKDFLKKDRLSENIRIGLMHDGKPESALICETLLCSVRSAGCRSFSFLAGNDAMARFACWEFLTDIFLFITEDENERIIKLYDKFGCPVSREFERKFEASYKSKKQEACSEIYDTVYIDNLKYFYISNILKALEEEFRDDGSPQGILNGCKYYIENYSENSVIYYILKAILTELGAELTTEFSNDAIFIYISADGTSGNISERNNGKIISLDDFHISRALLTYSVNYGNCLFTLPYFASVTASFLIKNGYKNTTKDVGNNTLSDSFVKEIRKIYDMCYAVPRLLCILKKENKTISAFNKELPQFEIKIRNIDGEETGGEYRASVMKRLYDKYEREKNLTEKDGFTLDLNKGKVTVIPRRTGGFKLVSEAMNSEIATELCDIVFDEIKNIISDSN